MSARKLAYLAVGVSIAVCLCSVGLANAFETKYYNKVPYSALFQTNSKQIKVQKTGEGGQVVQAVIPVEQEEEKVEQQELKGENPNSIN